MPTVEKEDVPAALRKLASAARRDSVLITAYEALTLDAAAGRLEAMEAERDALRAALNLAGCRFRITANIVRAGGWPSLANDLQANAAEVSAALAPAPTPEKGVQP